MGEEIPPEYEYTPTTEDTEVNSGELTAEEKAALLEATKKMVEESSQRVAEARDGTEALKKESEDAKQAFVAQQTAARETQAQAVPVEDSPKPVVKSAAEIALEKEREEAKEKKKEEADKEQEEKRSRKKQWEAEDNERKQREKAMEDNIRQEKEREKKAREMKKKDEEEKRLE